jgi:hypothetical protein
LTVEAGLEIGGTWDGQHVSLRRVKQKVGINGTVTFCELK